MFTYNNHSSGGRVGTAIWNCTCVCSVASVCLTLCDPMDCSPAGSSVHGILQARILEWVAIPSSRESSQPRDWDWVSCVSCIASSFFFCFFFFYHWAAREVLSEINVHKLCNKTNQYLGWHYWKLEFSLWVSDVTLKMARKKNLGIQNLSWKYRY